MGVRVSRPACHWQPPPEPDALSSNDPPVDCHVVACQVTFGYGVQILCSDKHVTCDKMYAVLKEQYQKGYRMLHFMRAPGEMYVLLPGIVLKVVFQAYFRKNPTQEDTLGHSTTSSWELDIAQVFVNSKIEDKYTPNSGIKRMLQVDTLVEAITCRTQNGERLIAACLTGKRKGQKSGDAIAGKQPDLGMDLLFEIPHPAPGETYVYNHVLVPVHVVFADKGAVYFPSLHHDWMATLSEHLNHGWRLIDIHLDVPLSEQIWTRQQVRYMHHCRPTETNILWIFEKPRSRVHNPMRFYEGAITEKVVPVCIIPSGGDGVMSRHDFTSEIRDMGSRGWELATVLECHSFESVTMSNIQLKSLLFFQRPIQYAADVGDIIVQY